MDRDIQKRKTKLSPALPPALNGKSPVNFGPFSTAFSQLMFTHKKWSNGQVLLAHTSQEMRVPFNNFLMEGQKLASNVAYEPLELWR